MFNFNLKFTKKIPFYELMVIGSFNKLSAMEDKKKGYSIEKNTLDIFKIKECSIEKSTSFMYDEENNNKTNCKYFEVKYNDEYVVQTINYQLFRNTYGRYLDLKSKFLCNDDFRFFCMFNNLILLYDVLKNLNNKHFNCFHEIYFNSLTIFNKLIKMYKAYKLENLNSVSFKKYINKNINNLTKKIEDDLTNKIKSDVDIDEYLLPIWNCMISFFSVFKESLFLGKIDNGGFGFVLECIQGQIDKKYNEKKILTFSEPLACKFTLKDLLKNELVVSKFNHKNIVKILEYRKLSPLSCVLMPKYVANLLTVAKFYNQIPMLRDYGFLNRISFQMLGVLKYLRGKYFHNDIKPANLLLDSNNNIIFIDFSAGYNADVEYSTLYDRFTYLFCSKHILRKINQLRIINRDNLLKIYNDNKDKFLNSEVFKNNYKLELDFDELSEEEKYKFLIKNIENFEFEINFRERKFCIADICDMRSDIEPSTDDINSIDINGIKYPKNTLCIDNLFKADYYALALVIHSLFNGMQIFDGINNIPDMLKKYDNGTFKIDYNNKNMHPNLISILKIIADDNFFSSPINWRVIDEEFEKYDNNLGNKKNKKNAANKIFLKKIKKPNISVKKDANMLLKDILDKYKIKINYLGNN